MLNYSYMLGEIEVMITTGGAEEQKSALRLLSLFTEQRSLNMILELLKGRLGEDSDIIRSALSILLERDISGNITANQIFKGIIANNASHAIRSFAILGIGQCRFDSDIDFLNDLFYKMGPDEPKDVIVRAVAGIITNNTSYNKRQLMRYLQEYLKDPGIKVRIYSCLILAQLGNRDALRSIRDMLVIKNKGIQRDILTIIGDLKSIEFSFFLLSLLKEEYGISKDIIPVIVKLPVEEMKEIDGFVVNIFRKYEAPAIDGLQPAMPAESGEASTEGMAESRVTILNVLVSDQGARGGEQSIPGLINLNLRIKDLITVAIQSRGGTVTKLSNTNVVSYFPDARSAAEAAFQMQRNIIAFNELRIAGRSIDVYPQLLTESVKIVNDEIIELPLHAAEDFAGLPVQNRIIVDRATAEALADSYSMREIPRLVLSLGGHGARVFEMLNPINFLSTSESLVKTIREEEEKREQAQQLIEAELKKLKRGARPASSAAIARGLDDLGQQLQGQLEEIERYVQKRSTDRELIKNVRRMLSNVNNLYKVEISRLIID